MKKSQKIIVTTLIENKLTLLGQPEPLKVKYDVHWNPFFKALKMVFATFALEGVSKLKHHYKLTFEIIESLRGLVWHFRLFLCIAMILMTVSSTHIWLLKTERNFSHGTPSQAWRAPTSIFLKVQNGQSHFCLWGGYENSKITVTSRLRS